MNMSKNKDECDTLGIEGMTDELLVHAINSYVNSRMTRCSQSQFRDYLQRSLDAGLRDIEAYKHALFMAAFNEVALDAVMDAIERADVPPIKGKKNLKKS